MKKILIGIFCFGMFTSLCYAQQAGVGRTVTANRVQAFNGSATSPSLSFFNDTNTGLYRASEDNLRITTFGIDRMVFDNAGNVGIGTIPLYKLDISGVTNTVSLRVKEGGINVGDIGTGNGFLGFHPTHLIPSNQFFVGSSYSNSSGNLSLSNSSADISIRFSDNTNFPFRLYSSFWNGASYVYTERLRVDGSNGNVAIGTSSPNTNAILDVASTTKAFMPPRMTTTQRDAIPSPTAGMVIYNTTTNVMNFYNGSVWGAF